MSSIMRRRNGLTASADSVEVMGGSGLEVGVLTPSILKPASRPVIPQRIICSSVLAHPPLRAQRAPAVAGSFFVQVFSRRQRRSHHAHGDRRLKSAKARSRGKLGTGWQRAL
jgi:hypothetical protein